MALIQKHAIATRSIPSTPSTVAGSGISASWPRRLRLRRRRDRAQVRRAPDRTAVRSSAGHSLHPRWPSTGSPFSAAALNPGVADDRSADHDHLVDLYSSGGVASQGQHPRLSRTTGRRCRFRPVRDELVVLQVEAGLAASAWVMPDSAHAQKLGQLSLRPAFHVLAHVSGDLLIAAHALAPSGIAATPLSRCCSIRTYYRQEMVEVMHFWQCHRDERDLSPPSVNYVVDDRVQVGIRRRRPGSTCTAPPRPSSLRSRIRTITRKRGNRVAPALKRAW